jgi:glycosyltransferase involved in cell wall biosynthesis
MLLVRARPPRAAPLLTDGQREVARRRIVFLAYAGGWGGTEVNLIGLLRALAQRGHDVVLAQLEHETYRVPEEKGWSVVHVPLPRPYAQVRFREWRVIVDSLRPELCVVVKTGHTAMRSLRLDLAVRMASRHYLMMENHPAHPIPRPCRKSWRRYVPVPGPRRLFDWLHASVHHWMAHHVVAVSRTVRDRLVSDYAAAPRRVSVMYAGVDVQTFSFDPERRRRARSDLAVPEGAFVFGTAARLAWVKRLDRLIDAFAAVSRGLGRPTRLLIAGEGPDGDRLRDRAAAAGLGGLVLFPGFVPSAVDALCAMDGFVVTSEVEGLGMALLEAMACERPVISVRCGGPAEILSPDDSRGLLTGGEVDDIARAMTRLMAVDAVNRAEMGRRARAHVVRNFDAAVQFERLADLVERA